MSQFYTIVTNEGTKKIAAMVTGEKLKLSKLVIGDSNGSYYEPSVKQTKLKNVKYEADINSIKTNKDNPNWLTVEAIIPANVGGFYIREVGILDEDGVLIAVSKYSETHKPEPAEGTAKELLIRLVIDVDNIENINLTINGNMAAATHEDLEEIKELIDKKSEIYVVTTGEVNDYNVTSESVIEYAKGLGLYIEIHKTNTSAATLN
ncbi:phage tail protein, partial [Clostridium botulinum]